MPTKPPQFILNVSDQTFQSVKKDIEDRTDISGPRKALWISALTKTVGAQTWSWQQDFFRPVIVSGRPQLRANIGYNAGSQQGDVAAAARTSVTDQITNQCGIASGPNYASDIFGDGAMGGNIQGGPAGLCVVGSSDLTDNDWTKLARDLCGTSSLLKAPTSFLEVGHTDEILATIRTGPKSCDLVTLIASPRAAMTALQKDPTDRPMIFLKPYVDKIRERIAELERIPNPTDEQQAELSRLATTRIGARLGLFCDALQRRSDLLGWGIQFDPDSRYPQGSAERYQQGYVNCENGLMAINNLQLFDVVKNDQTLSSLHLEVEREMEQFKGDLAAALIKTACAKIKTIAVPNLFSGTVVADSTTGRTTVYGARSLFSSPTNLQQFGDTLLIPDPGSKALRSDIRVRISKASAKLKVNFIDTTFANAHGGNLHCQTNAIRYCRPVKARGASLDRAAYFQYK